MNAHIPRAITVGLRLRGIEVLTAQEDNATNLSAPELLDRARALQRVVFTSALQSCFLSYPLLVEID
jgi:lipid-binding SYLF domain-containing protein